MCHWIYCCFFYVGFWLSAYSSCRSGVTREKTTRAVVNLFLELCLPDSSLSEEDQSNNLKMVNRLSISAFCLFVCFFLLERYNSLSIEWIFRTWAIKRPKTLHIPFKITFIFLFCFLPKQLRWCWFFTFFLGDHTSTACHFRIRGSFWESKWRTPSNWGSEYFIVFVLHHVTFHFPFWSENLHFIIKLSTYLGSLPLTFQNCWPDQPVCECNASVLPHWELLVTKQLILEEKNQFGQTQLSVQQHWCVAFAIWPIRPASSEKW